MLANLCRATLLGALALHGITTVTEARAQTARERFQIAGQLLSDARKDAVRIPDPELRDLALAVNASWQLELKDVPGALLSANSTSAHFNPEFLLEIGKIQAAAGDRDGSIATLELARQAIAADPEGEQFLADLSEIEAEIIGWTAALQTAGTISDPEKRVAALLFIADQQIKVGNTLEAADTMQLVLQSGEDASTSEYRLESIGLRQARLGDTRGLRATLARMASPRALVAVRLESAHHLADSYDLAGARREFTEVRRLAENSAAADTRDIFLAQLAEAQANAGQLHDAVVTANAIRDCSAKVHASLSLAEFFTKAGAMVESEGMRAQARSVSIEVAAGNPSCLEGLLPVVRQLAESGDVDGAHLVALAAPQSARSIGIWLTIAYAEQARGGRAAVVAFALTQAEASAEMATGTEERDGKLLRVAGAYVDFGDLQGANSVVTQITDAPARLDGALLVANAQLNDVQGSTGPEGTVDVLRASAALNSEQRSARATSIATFKARTGDFRGALAEMAMVSNPWEQVPTYIYIADRQLQSGDRRGAVSSITSALIVAESLESADQSADLLRKVAAAQAALGDKVGAAGTLRFALDRIASLPLRGASGLDLEKPMIAALLAGDRVAMGDVAGALKWIRNYGRDPVLQASMRIGAAVALIDPQPMGSRVGLDLLEPKGP